MAPELDFSEISSFCQLGPLPQLVTGFFVQWFRYHFSAQARIEFPALRSLLWRKTLGDAQIFIDDIAHWKPEETGHRPAILVARNDWEPIRRGINDMLMGMPSSNTEQHYAIQIQGSHTFFGVSNIPAQAEIIGSEIAREVIRFGPAIRRELDIKRFLPAGIGKRFEIEEAHQAYAVPVTVAYILEDTWQLVPHTPFLKRFDIDFFLP